MQVYVRRWRPSQYFVDLTAEVILDVNTLSHLKQKLSQLSGLPAEDIHYAKARVCACMGLEEDVKYMAVCVRMCGMHGAEGRCQVYGCV